MKETVLVFCSWLDLDTNIGVFFREQAHLISDVYNPILIVFKEVALTKKRINYKHIIAVKEKISSEGLLVLEVSYPYRSFLPLKLNDYFKMLTIKSLSRFLLNKNIKVSFIHAQSIFDAAIWALKYNEEFKTPYIITEHNQLSFYNVPDEKCKLVRKSLEKSKNNLVVSNDKIRQFASNGLFFDFTNVGNLITKEFFFNTEKSDTKKIRLITIGAFSPLKDQLTILKALSIIDKKISNKIEFVWVGYDAWGGNYTKRVNDLVASFMFSNIEIVLIPSLDRFEIAEYLQKSDIFLFSSLSEGMPVSVLEALACGLPVFTTNCGGVDEIINESNGIIYQIKDYLKLSELILDFVDNKFPYNKENISIDIIEKFGEIAFKDKLLSIYKTIK